MIIDERNSTACGEKTGVDRQAIEVQKQDRSGIGYSLGFGCFFYSLIAFFLTFPYYGEFLAKSDLHQLK